MFKNYLKIALRNLTRHKGFNFINIAGLAVGMACCLFILLYVRDELSFDQFHQNADRIYRVTREIQSENRQVFRAAVSIAPLGPTLMKDEPSVEQAVRIRKFEHYVSREANRFYEDKFFYADNGFFELFTFPLLKGDPTTALAEPYSVVITDEIAQKYFGAEEPLGQTLAVNDTVQFKVTGVLASIPSQSHFTFDFLASFETLFSENQINTARQYFWWSFNTYTYVLLKENASQAALADQLYHFGDKYIADLQERFGSAQRFYLQPLNEIYLHSNLAWEFGQTGNIIYIYVFLIIAVLVLIIACINFINLSTARSVHRGREIGMRKTLGAYRGQLARQLLAESLLSAFIAMVFAVLLMEFFLPFFNTLSGKSLALNLFNDLTVLLSLAGIVLIAGLIAGSYPAFVLSGFKPILALGTSVARGMQSVQLRKILVIFQFAASIILIIATLVVSNQLAFMREQNLGFDKEQMIVIPIRNNADIRGRFEAIKSEFLKTPAVKGAASSSTVPAREIPSIVYRPEGAKENETQSINTMVVDYDFLATYNVQLAAGRAFSRDFATDAQEGFVINEAAVKNLDWGEADDAIGKQFTWGWPGKEGRIIGVVKDFHYNSLHKLVEPLVMHIQPSWLQYLSLKVESGQIDRVLSELETTWQRLVPNRPFDYFFLDENFDRQYRSEEKLSGLFMVFAGLAIFVACLGLFSLAALIAEQRTKEVGVRKVFGATVANLIALLSKDFLKLVAIAAVIAWPLAGLVLNRWLQDFAYRIPLEQNWWVFALAGVLALAIALLTVSTQAIRAALANPVEALRYE